MKHVILITSLPQLGRMSDFSIRLQVHDLDWSHSLWLRTLIMCFRYLLFYDDVALVLKPKESYGLMVMVLMLRLTH